MKFETKMKMKMRAKKTLLGVGSTVEASIGAAATVVGSMGITQGVKQIGDGETGAGIMNVVLGAVSMGLGAINLYDGCKNMNDMMKE